MKIGASEKDHQAEMDARTLTEAQEIRDDPERYRRAKKKLKSQVKDTTKAAKREGIKLGNIRGR